MGVTSRLGAFVLTGVTLCLLVALSGGEQHQTALPTSKLLTLPTPGQRVGRVNGFPATIAFDPNGRYAAILNDGYGTEENRGYQSIEILDLRTDQLRDFPEARLPVQARQTYFLGLAFSSDGKHLYASMASLTDPTGARAGNTGNGIAVYGFRQGKVIPERFIKIGLQKIAVNKRVAAGLRRTAPHTAIPYPAGLAVVPGPSNADSKDELMVANNLSDNVVVLDPANGRVLKQFDLSTQPIIPSAFPYSVMVARDGRHAWCSLWNSSRVVELDLRSGTVVRSIPLLEPHDPIAPGSHPTALLLSPDEKLLYVSLSNADRVAVVRTDEGKLIRLLDTSVPAQKYAGTSPVDLARSADGKRLFVADSAIDAVAVFDTSAFLSRGTSIAAALDHAMGFIPTDWYPSALAISGDDLLIASAKGQGTGPSNRPGKLDWERTYHKPAYIASLVVGSVARLKIQDALAKLGELSSRVARDNLFESDPGTIRFAQGHSPISHLIYVIKENRTYDQVFGDLKEGNGDSSLTLYGEDVTPNEHKLALQFGILDNFYDSGAVSGDGHLWSTAAITTDYNEKAWPIAYRGNERNGDFGGEVEGELPLKNNEPDIDDPSTGYLWDNLARHGIGYRDYGEFVRTEWCRPGIRRTASRDAASPSPKSECSPPAVYKGESLPSNVRQPHGSPSSWPWAVPLARHTDPTKAVLRNHCDLLFPGFNPDYPDQLRADEFLNEFEGFVRARKDGKGSELPTFVLLYLPNDHTEGTLPGKPRPTALVADNDLALGRVVEAVSHSPYWNDTAIFVVEDDAQDGADHVDAHRSTALVISRYSSGSIGHPFVEHRFYTTVNMVHTIEALLNLPPMNQNDAYAPVMASLFSGPGNQQAFQTDWRNRDNGLIYQTNPVGGQGAKESARLDFTRPDAANPAVLNAILWRDRKGTTLMSAPKHSVFP